MEPHRDVFDPRCPSALSANCVQVANAAVGEGPVWDERKQALWWFDIRQKRIFLYSPDRGQIGQWWLRSQIYALSLTAGRELLIALEDGLYLFHPETEELERFGTLVHGEGASRFNDGKVDPAGRFWVGTRDLERATPTGALYRVEGDGSHARKLEGVRGSNGLGWTADGRRMFFTDSPNKVIWSFNFDVATGEISAQDIFTTVEEEGSTPDGLSVDTEGCVWSAMFGGGAVVRYDPTGREIARVQTPVPHPTSCAFGGPRHATLFITSESYHLPATVLSQSPQAGALFAVKTDSVGVEVARFRLPSG